MQPMTVNSINYGNLLESRRHNSVTEREQQRSNMEREAETRRSNLAREYESRRANAVHETIQKQQLEETKRANVTNEGIQMRKQEHYESTVWPQDVEQRRFGNLMKADPYDWITFAATGGDIHNAKLSDFTDLAKRLVEDTTDVIPDLGSSILKSWVDIGEASVEGGKNVVGTVKDWIIEGWNNIADKFGPKFEDERTHPRASGSRR